MVCRLSHFLYGLKQAPLAWLERFTTVVIATDYLASDHGPAVFVCLSPLGLTLLYVDDMIISTLPFFKDGLSY
jgi:hypothetical protein